ncbi:MAG: ATP-binding protein [Cyanothece sp. SIO1E1]|nr:ATP-binding protein [Cyanothece sp. SIO1E1]
MERLWQRFRDLLEQSSKANVVPRVLPILGPSGCGKSSLARAGLIPELARRPLAGKEQMRVAVIVPGTHPIDALAGVLVKVATQDPMPVAKKREFATELKLQTVTGDYDGMRRIADLMPHIKDSPLLVLVDQFEEVYSLCKQLDERRAFIETLLHAASDPTGNVSVILTLRSDFLGQIQQHRLLNQVIGSDQSMIVPAMMETELRCAIAEPAKQAGRPLDEAMIDLLVKDTEGREGALPLLQFALTQIWQEVSEGKDPAQTYREMGGVGGALAGEAQRIYNNKLDDIEKDIARRVFVGLVQLGEGTRNTRRRVAVKDLVASRDTLDGVKQVICQFSSPGARLITLSNQENYEIAELTHEALLEHWHQLKDWLDINRNDIRFQRRLDEAARLWHQGKRNRGRLWRSTDLALLKKYAKRANDNLTDLQLTFLRTSERAARQEQAIVALGLIAIVAAPLGLLWQQNRTQKIIESVFLGSDTAELLTTLPELMKSADRFRKRVDRLQTTDNPQQQVDYYQQHQPDIHRALAYYRNVLTAAGRLEQDEMLDATQKTKLKEEIIGPAEVSLAELIFKYRIPQLELHLQQSPPAFGQLREKGRLDFENQYSRGALRTTYEILMRNSGAGADLNNDGFIGDSQEANQIPCQTLKEIERLWRKATEDQCSWYSSIEDPYNSIGCKKVDPQQRSLYASIFGYAQNFDLERIQGCNILPHYIRPYS